METTRLVLNTYGGVAANLLADGQVFCIVSFAEKIQYFTWEIFSKAINVLFTVLPIVAIPAPNIISKIPNIRALQACHKHREVIFPRTTCTFHVAPDAGCARRTGGPNDIFLRLCHCDCPRACIPPTKGGTKTRRQWLWRLDWRDTVTSPFGGHYDLWPMGIYYAMDDDDSKSCGTIYLKRKCKY